MSLNPSFTLTILVLLLSTIPSSKSSLHTCSTTSPSSSCPPFLSNPPYPFSSTPGCGHPSFHLTCSSPHSLISINNLSFSILSFNPNSSSLLLSPHLPHPNTTTSTCPPSLSIPSHPINLSSTPFRISDASCSRLSFLHPCSPPSLSNCSHCPWHCNLIRNPLQLLHDCRSMHHSSTSSQQTCQIDVLSSLHQILSKGILLEWDQSQDTYFTDCTNCRNNNGLCGFNSSHPNKQFLCFRSRATLSPTWIRTIKTPNRTIVFTLLVAFTSLLFLVSLATVILRSGRLNFNTPSSGTEQDPTALFLRNHRSASLLPPVFTYEELASSTNNFDSKRKIGDGGFGSVFLAHLRDGRFVAVKYHHAAAAAFSTKSFCNEILILSSINHPNLVKLHGYCSDPRGLLLVYDYVPNGTLAEHLHNRKGSLPWQTRLDVALQTALVMEYLHFSVVPPVVHRDITSSNIFMERDMRIKVGDFGLSRLLVVQETTSSSGGYVWTGPQGTPGYLDPDYHRSFRLTEKSDVYSFGVVLLELISGLRAVDQSRDKREMALADLVVSRIQTGQLHQVLDPFLKREGEAVDEAVAAVAELAFRCVAADKDDRPDSREVVEELKRVRTRTVGV